MGACWCACLGCALFAGAQTSGAAPAGPHAAAPHHRSLRAVSHRSKYEAKKPAQPVAQPPAVTLKDGKLTVDAHDSDLSAILSDVARMSGMTVDGQQSSARVFGVYGPASPRQVLTELLDGLGYNFMMVGDTPGGAPRELLLTARTSAPPGPAKAAAAAPEPSDAADDQEDQEPPGPGAIVHVPPSVAQQADESETQQRVQQQLERLQKMREAEAQQQANQPQ